MKKRVSFYTLGCKLNQYETDNIRDKFIKSGYSVVDFGKQADVSIVNTCAVTQRAEFKSRQTIRRAIKYSPQAFIIVVGCYAQINDEDLSRIPGVNMILGSEEKFKVLDFLDGLNKTDKVFIKKSSNSYGFYKEEGNGYFTDRTRAFLKIQDGCNYYCSYCIVLMQGVRAVVEVFPILSIRLLIIQIPVLKRLSLLVLILLSIMMIVILHR